MLCRATTLIAVCVLLASCASMEELVESPRVSLRSVKLQDLDIKKQTFLLSFDVTNPNPISLPIDSVSYDVRLDGYRFASGNTPGSFTIPASSDAEFAIRAELDLLNTAPQLLSIVRAGAYRDIPYELIHCQSSMPPISFLNSDGNASTIFITTLLLDPERSSST